MQSCKMFINFLSTFINILSTFYQLFINFYKYFINFLSTFINFLSTFYQRFINFLSTSYQPFVNILSTFYPHVISFQLFKRVHLQEMAQVCSDCIHGVCMVQEEHAHSMKIQGNHCRNLLNIPQHTVRISVSSVAQHCCALLRSILFGSKCTAIQFCVFKWQTIIPKCICE